MANKVPIINEQGAQVFPITHVSAVIDNNGNSVEQVLGAHTDLIQQAQMEVGAVPSDLTPTAGSTNWVTSGGVYSTLLKNTFVVFENKPTTYWISGNVSSGNVRYNYANMFTILRIPYGSKKLSLTRGESSYNLSIFVSNSPRTGYVSASRDGNIVNVEGYSYMLLVLWDKPSLANAQAESILVTCEETVQAVENNIHANSRNPISTDAINQTFYGKVLNESKLAWVSGNISSKQFKSNYDNRVAFFSLDEAVTTFDITISDLADGYNCALLVNNNGVFTDKGSLVPGEKTTITLGSASSEFALLVWDKPTDSTVSAIKVLIEYGKGVIPDNILGSDQICHDYFDSSSDLVASMDIFSPMAEALYIEKLTTENGGIEWIQGGINGQTGVWESNPRAICSKPIQLNGDADAIVYKGSLANETACIAVYDENGTYVGWNRLPSEGDCIRFVFFGSVTITPSSGANAGSYVIRKINLIKRIEEIEQSGVSKSYTNPVYKNDFPDPTVWDGEDGYFYALSTGAISTKTMLRSANLVDWEDTLDKPYTDSVASDILSAFSSGTARTSYWAPCVYKVDNTQWNMYLTKPYGGVLFLTSKYPTFGYEVVRMTTASFSDYIDADVARDRDGTLWMFAGSNDKMYRRQLTDDGLDFAEGSEWVHVAGRPGSESGNTNRIKTFEGEYLYRHGGYWYLFCSSGQYANSTYALRVVRSQTLNGIFVDKSGNLATDGYAETILSSSSSLYGPGHNAQIIADRDGRTWMLYHSHWDGASSSSVRPMCLSEVLWGDDGWPYFAGGVPNETGVAPNF